MPPVETLLQVLHTQATPEELRQVSHFIGECVARRESSTLAKFHTRARQLRRLAEAGSWYRGFADNLTACLDGYFAELEPTIQREKLAREIADHPLWREILHTLRDDLALNQVTIGDLVATRVPGVASSKSAISIALEDLRVRELVEYVPGKIDRRERIHSLTVRGRELLSEPIVASALAHGVSDKADDDSSAALGITTPSQSAADTESERPRRRSAAQPSPPDASGEGSRPSDGNQSRKRRVSSHPPSNADG